MSSKSPAGAAESVPVPFFDAPLDPSTLTDTAARRRLSGPGLRAFLNIAALWGLKESARRLALGSPARSTYYKWVAAAEAGTSLVLSLDTLVRLSALLGIHKSLRILFGEPSEGVTWLTTPNRDPLFNGRRPLDLILTGTPMGLIDLRRFVDAWRGGLSAAPIAHSTEDRPWTVDDIRILDD